MNYDISFPNIGIYLDHVGKSISVFGFEIAYYGIIIGSAILIGFLIATAEAKQTRQNPEDYLDMGIIGVIAGIAGARIYYVIFSWDMYKDNLLDIFNLREGGLAIYGGVIGAVIAVFVLARVKRLSPFQILDTVSMRIQICHEHHHLLAVSKGRFQEIKHMVQRFLRLIHSLLAAGCFPLKPFPDQPQSVFP